MKIKQEKITIKQVKIKNLGFGTAPGICNIYLDDPGVPIGTIYNNNIQTISLAEAYGNNFRYKCTIENYPNDRIINSVFCTLQYSMIIESTVIPNK